MPAPRAAKHTEITIIREYGGDPARATAALVKLLEHGATPVDKTGAGAATEVRGHGTQSPT